MSDEEQIKTLSAEVKPIGELLQYQDSSIVSRVLLKNKGGTVTLFAFDQGEGLSEHTAPFEALVFVVDGKAEVEVAGEVYSVRNRRDDHASGKRSARSEGGDQIQDAADHDTSITGSTAVTARQRNQPSQLSSFFPGTGPWVPGPLDSGVAWPLCEQAS